VDAGTLWTRFHGELFAFVRPRVDSAEVAEDLLQSAFLSAHRRLVAGDVPEHPRAWLHQIVRNLIIDARRRARRQRDLAEAVFHEPAFDPVRAGTHTEADERDAFAAVARALPMFIEALDPIYRDALHMTELEGLTQTEAAERAGVTLSGMKARVQRGRRQIYEALQQCCEFEVDARGRMTNCTRRDKAAERDPAACC
jgi:RNA polymerase sigma-70 factor (ECF subfamily)